MDEVAVPQINADMGNPFFVCVLEEHEIARLRGVYIVRSVEIAVGVRTCHVFSGSLERIPDKAATVEAGRSSAGPLVRCANHRLGNVDDRTGSLGSFFGLSCGFLVGGGCLDHFAGVLDGGTIDSQFLSDMNQVGS